MPRTAHLEISYFAGLLMLVAALGFLTMLVLGPKGDIELERRIVSVGWACLATLILRLLLLALAAGISRLHGL
jgi:hypothetical protein